MTTLREAAQQALEALEWFNRYGTEEHGPSLRGAEHYLRAALAEPVQEPVAWRFQSAVGGWAYGSEPPLGSKYPAYPLYAAPPQRKPLTDEEIHDCWQQRHRDKATERRLITRAIERAHGIGGQE